MMRHQQRLGMAACAGSQSRSSQNPPIPPFIKWGEIVPLPPFLKGGRGDLMKRPSLEASFDIKSVIARWRPMLILTKG